MLHSTWSSHAGDWLSQYRLELQFQYCAFMVSRYFFALLLLHRCLWSAPQAGCCRSCGLLQYPGGCLPYSSERDSTRGSSSSRSNNSEPSSTATSSSSRGQTNRTGGLGGKKDRGSCSSRSSSACKAETQNASKGREGKGARSGDNINSSSSRAESSGEDTVLWFVFMQTGRLLEAPEVFDKLGEQFILRTWQHYKAYLSAHASWNKACIKLMLLLMERGVEFGLTETGEHELTGIMDRLPVTMHRYSLGPRKGVEFSQHADAVGGSRGGCQQQKQQQYVQVQQQQWGQVQPEQQQEGVQAQQQQLGMQAQHEEDQQQQSEQHSPLGEQQQLASDCGNRGVQGCAPDGMSTGNTIQLLLLLGKARIVMALGRALICKLAGLEEVCQGSNEPVTGSSSSKGGDNSNCGTSDLSSSSSSSSTDIVVAPSDASQTILVEVTTSALQLRECLAYWQRTASGQATARVEHATPPSSSSPRSPSHEELAEGLLDSVIPVAITSAAANTATAAVLGNAAVNGPAVVRDESRDAASTGCGAAALVGSALPASNVTAAVVLPERFFRVPSQGFPEAVIDQLDQLSSLYGPPGDDEGNPLTPEQVRMIVEGLADEAPVDDQLEMLAELLLLCEVLLAEVPCPLGCSNSGCVNLEGESEVREAHKACAACKVVYYCSRRCQVDHWKAGHGKICGHLGQHVKQQEQLLQ